MSILAPLWLLLGSAAAVPLVIHLLRRRTRERTEFPAARYLARAERDHSRSLRLRNLLLMFLRMAIVLLLTLAAARPSGSLPPAWGGGGGAPTALAVVIDNSMSTGIVQSGRPLFETLRDSARSAIAAARSEDRVWIVAADARLRGGTPASARAALDSVGLLRGRGDLASAVRRAAAALTGADSHLPRIVVLTDGQRTAWPAEIDLPRDLHVLTWRPPAAPPPNRAVVHVEPRPLRWTPRGMLALRVLSPDSLRFRVVLHAGGAPARTMGRGIAAAGEEVRLSASPADTGWLGGWVEIDPDELPADDTRYFALWRGAAPRVLAAESAGPFVRNALEVLQADGRVQAGSDILVGSPDAKAPAGDALLTAPLSAAQLGAANRGLARRGVPWRFGRPLSGRLQGARGIAGSAVRIAYELVPVGAAVHDTLAMLDDHPWAVAGTAAGARYVLVASPLHADAADVPVRAAFVPWLASVLNQWLTGGTGDVHHVEPGAASTWPPWADSLRLVTGEMIAPTQSGLTAPHSPGVHFFMRRGRTVGALVVNAEERESVLERLDHVDLAGRIAGARVTPMSTARAWRGLAADDAAHSLVPSILAVAGVLLIAELGTVIFRQRRTT